MDYKQKLKKFKLNPTQINNIIKKISEYAEEKELLYDILGKLHAKISYKEIIQDLENENFGVKKWNSSVFSKYRNNRDKKDKLQDSKIEIREGDIECPKCHQKKTVIVEMQTRSCDEGYTSQLFCFNEECKYTKIMDNF
jgi:DNA-directed RNA polymerase subunit M/transcription elongation factor TFIIS